FPSVEAACEAVIGTIQMGIPVARIELLDALSVRALNSYSKLDLPESPLLLLEFHGSPASVQEHAQTFDAISQDCDAQSFEWTTNAEERTRIWQARHDAYWAQRALRPGTDGVATDICVPISNLATAVTRAQKKADELDLLSPILGHVGDGNFHCTLLIDRNDDGELQRAKAFTDWLSELAVELEGTITGEHGIGQGKIAKLEAQAGGSIEMMRAIKRALDPQNIMNPGKIITID
ncbi:MAG: FAD-linked oxidase C-terminal domain-containing protein, partial [Pseudomonadota bacterium]